MRVVLPIVQSDYSSRLDIRYDEFWDETELRPNAINGTKPVGRSGSSHMPACELVLRGENVAFGSRIFRQIDKRAVVRLIKRVEEVMAGPCKAVNSDILGHEERELTRFLDEGTSFRQHEDVISTGSNPDSNFGPKSGTFEERQRRLQARKDLVMVG